jgi:glucokinase
MEENMTSSSRNEPVVGIDLGGTSVAVGLVTPAGGLLECGEFPTEAGRGPEHVVQNIGRRVRSIAKSSDVPISLAGIGAPGPLDTATGMIVEMPNLGWRNLPLREMLHRELGFPVFLENDANAAAYGEFWVGAGAGSRCLVGLTLGTGVGGGIVIGGEVFRGVSDAAAEFGHMIVEIGGRRCGCGKSGCLEQYASAAAVARRAAELVAAGGSSLLADLTGGDVSLVTSEMVCRAAGEGDCLAGRVIAEAVSTLAVAVSNIVNALNPDTVVIGGGLAGAGDLLFGPLRAQVADLTFEVQCRAMHIVPTALGRCAGVIGSAGLALVRSGAGIGVTREG